MNILQSGGLKRRAASLLEQTRPEYRKLVTLHAAVSVGVMLVISLIQLLLNQITSNESGLSGMGASVVFSTAKATLGLISGILLPFWEIGVLYTSVRVTRRQEAEFLHLTRGFRRWGVVLRFYLLLILLYIVAVMFLSNLIPVIMIFFPMSQTLEDSLTAVISENGTDSVAMMEAVMQAGVMDYILPIVVIFMVLLAAVLLWLSYRIRMSQYLLVDDPAMPAIPSLIVSNQMTKGHKWSLCKLDLSFWWYYLLQLGVAAISFGPELLMLAGVTLPISANVEFFLFQLLYGIAYVAVVWFFGAYVQTTYACAYDELRNPPQDNTVITV